MAAFFGADEIWNIQSSECSEEPVILVGVYNTDGSEYASEKDFYHSLDELAELSKACNMTPVYTITQQLPQVDKALYVRSGKAEEIAFYAEDMEAERIIFNDTLSPSQIRNLQKVIKKPVTDRTRLILDIFERRAGSREAKLQVELAKLSYLKPRLIGMWETQNRQGGASGALSSKGEGEKQLEIDRRTIDSRLAELRREIKEISKERQTQRKKRQNSGIPMVALIGYTNAGKSTIMNSLIEGFKNENARSDKKVFEANMVFATLDTTVRKIRIEKGKEFLLSDTVGFIRHLPTSLVEAFKSTLEEVTEADLLLQVVDASDEYAHDHIEVTKSIITELGAGSIPMITVFNKADMCEPAIDYPRRGLKETTIDGDINENIYISAKDPESISFLTSVVAEKLDAGNINLELTIPYSKGNVQAYIMENAVVSKLDYLDEGIFMQIRCKETVAGKVARMLEG
jgi:GTP-binding protein HflX